MSQPSGIDRPTFPNDAQRAGIRQQWEAAKHTRRLGLDTILTLYPELDLSAEADQLYERLTESLCKQAEAKLKLSDALRIPHDAAAAPMLLVAKAQGERQVEASQEEAASILAETQERLLARCPDIATMRVFLGKVVHFAVSSVSSTANRECTVPARALVTPQSRPVYGRPSLVALPSNEQMKVMQERWEKYKHDPSPRGIRPLFERHPSAEVNYAADAVFGMLVGAQYQCHEARLATENAKGDIRRPEGPSEFRAAMERHDGVMAERRRVINDAKKAFEPLVGSEESKLITTRILMAASDILYDVTNIRADISPAALTR